MTKYVMRWKEITESVKAHYVGSCINSFDEHGECLVPHLPWDTTSDLAVADENAEQVPIDTFLDQVDIPELIKAKTTDHDISYLEHGRVFMIYDNTDDVHYFFVR